MASPERYHCWPRNCWLPSQQAMDQAEVGWHVHSHKIGTFLMETEHFYVAVYKFP